MKAIKKFPYSEIELLRTAIKFDKKLMNHYRQIEGIDPDLNENFVEQFKRVLECSITHPQNKALSTEVSQLHNSIYNLTLQLKHHVMDVKYYFQKAFPHNSEIWEQYGYCEFEKITQNYFKLEICIQQLLKVVKYRTEQLRKVKFHFELIAEISELITKITALNSEVINYYEKNNSDDEERIENLNNLYYLMQIVDTSVRKYRINHRGELKSLILP